MKGKVLFMSVLDERNKLSAKIVAEIESVLVEKYGEIFRTGANLNTITFCVSDEGEKELFGSVKFTLHKANYDLDGEIEEYELFKEEKDKAAKLKEEKASLKAKEEERKAAARAEREAIKEKVRLEKIEKYLGKDNTNDES